MKKTFYTLLILILCWLSGFICYTTTINNYPIDDSATQAIIALTGGRNRITEAVKLLNQDIAPRLFITGVGKDISLKNIQNTQHLSITTGQNIEIGHKASNTIENAAEANEWIKKNNITTIRLVTSNYHMPRAIIEFKNQNPTLKITPHPVYSEMVEKKWWTSLRTFSLIFKEYNKFLYAYIRNKL